RAAGKNIPAPKPGKNVSACAAGKAIGDVRACQYVSAIAADHILENYKCVAADIGADRAVSVEVDDLATAGAGVIGVNTLAAIDAIGAGCTPRIHGDESVVTATELIGIGACSIDHGFRLRAAGEMIVAAVEIDHPND